MKNLLTFVALLISVSGIALSLAREEVRCYIGLESVKCPSAQKDQPTQRVTESKTLEPVTKPTPKVTESQPQEPETVAQEKSSQKIESKPLEVIPAPETNQTTSTPLEVIPPPEQ